MMLEDLLARGRTADVYEAGEGRVLRRYRDGDDAGGELAMMTLVAAAGFPVPKVFPERPRPTDLVMERVAGATMLVALVDGSMAPEEGGRMLAELLRRLHAVPPGAQAGPGERVLHLDLHPDNVLLSPRGPVVIDWQNAELGPPALDWATSALILAQAAVTRMVEPVELTRLLLSSLLSCRDPEEEGGELFGGQLAEACARRAANPTMSAEETAALGEAVELVHALA
ncbi:phosphotransferase [Nonomuraea sp. NPDC049725]|uniref:phosphotransferase n=1 Tax=Nonomuraea sp. NPDC049725 TaxID=3154508 RepID=UPI00343A22AC